MRQLLLFSHTRNFYCRSTLDGWTHSLMHMQLDVFVEILVRILPELKIHIRFKACTLDRFLTLFLETLDKQLKYRYLFLELWRLIPFLEINPEHSLSCLFGNIHTRNVQGCVRSV